ncbi:MAG: L-ribulose-5-phosphate 4-epimerase [Balneolaceae bacterium]
MSEFRELKERAYRSNMRINELGLVLATFGNVSSVDRKKEVFAIKPSGVPYDELQPGDMVIVDFESHVVEGDLRPSSDTKTHAVLYKEWEKIGGIVHTHSTYATAWAQAQKDIPILGTTHADHLTMDIPCAPPMSDEMIRGNYEYQTGIQILDEFRHREISYEEVEMILVGCHAPFTWGKTAEKAVTNSLVLEELAKMAFLSLQIAPGTSGLKDSLIKKHYERKHGKDSYYGQD